MGVGIETVKVVALPLSCGARGHCPNFGDFWWFRLRIKSVPCQGLDCVRAQCLPESLPGYLPRFLVQYRTYRQDKVFKTDP